MFKGIKDNFKKAEAAVVVENLLQFHINSGIFKISMPAKALANKMIQTAWDFKPDLLGGRFGVRPHKLSIAIFTFSIHVVIANESKSKLSNDFFYLCLMGFSKLIDEVSVNGRLYSLSETDDVIIEMAMKAAAPFIDELNSEFSSEDFDLLQSSVEISYTWDEWYKAFVDNACSVEGSRVTKDKSGFCLIDILDDEPLRRAHRDGICPVKHGMSFGKQFDITKFGV